MPDRERTTLDRAVERIAASGTIAIVMPDSPGLELIGSAAALAGTLRRIGKTVTLFAPPALPGTGLGPWGAIGESGEPLREFVISLDLTRSPIRELRYERDSKRLDLILSPAGGRIQREDVEFRYGTLRYELVVALGVPAIEAASRSIARAPELLYEKPVLNVDSNPANSRYGELNLVPEDGRGSPSVPELAYRLLTAMKTPLEAEDATALLAALAAATGNFRLAGTSADTFRIAGELAARGADRMVAERSLTASRSLSDEQLAARAIARSRFETATGTLWSVLTRDDFKSTGGAPDLLPQILDRLSELPPLRDLTALLWQDPEDGAVRCRIATSTDPVRTRLTARGAEAVSRGHLDVRGSFRSFEAAEAAARQLLSATGAVE